MNNDINYKRPFQNAIKRAYQRLVPRPTAKLLNFYCLGCAIKFEKRKHFIKHRELCAFRNKETIKNMLFKNNAKFIDGDYILCKCSANAEYDVIPMIQCDWCLCWSHTNCYGYEEFNLPYQFYCSFCLPSASSSNTSQHINEEKPKGQYVDLLEMFSKDNTEMLNMHYIENHKLMSETNFNRLDSEQNGECFYSDNFLDPEVQRWLSSTVDLMSTDL